MTVDGINVQELSQDAFRGVFHDVSIDIDRQGFDAACNHSEWRVVLKGPVRLNRNTKALYFATGFGEKDTHITEAITFAKEKIKQ